MKFRAVKINKTQILYSECSRRNSDVRTPDYLLTFKT